MEIFKLRNKVAQLHGQKGLTNSTPSTENNFNNNNHNNVMNDNNNDNINMELGLSIDNDTDIFPEIDTLSEVASHHHHNRSNGNSHPTDIKKDNTVTAVSTTHEQQYPREALNKSQAKMKIDVGSLSTTQYHPSPRPSPVTPGGRTPKLSGSSVIDDAVSLAMMKQVMSRDESISKCIQEPSHSGHTNVGVVANNNGNNNTSDSMRRNEGKALADASLSGFPSSGSATSYPATSANTGPTAPSAIQKRWGDTHAHDMPLPNNNMGNDRLLDQWEHSVHGGNFASGLHPNYFQLHPQQQGYLPAIYEQMYYPQQTPFESPFACYGLYGDYGILQPSMGSMAVPVSSNTTSVRNEKNNQSATTNDVSNPSLSIEDKEFLLRSCPDDEEKIVNNILETNTLSTSLKNDPK